MGFEAGDHFRNVLFSFFKKSLFCDALYVETAKKVHVERTHMREWHTQFYSGIEKENNTNIGRMRLGLQQNLQMQQVWLLVGDAVLTLAVGQLLCFEALLLIDLLLDVLRVLADRGADVLVDPLQLNRTMRKHL
jgi:hypothetical protein